MWKEKINNVTFYSLCLLACFPILNMKLAVIAIILFCLLSLIGGILNYQSFQTPIRFRELGILLALFILIFLRTFVFEQSKDSMQYLEVSLSLLALPLAFYFTPSPKSEKTRMIPCWLFATSTALLVFYGLFISGLKLTAHLGPDKFWKTASQLFEDPSLPYYVRTLFEETIGVHPTHASVYLGISILIVAYSFMKKFKTSGAISKTGKAVLILLLFFLQVILASRTPFVATILGLMVLLFVSIKNKRYAIYTTFAVIVLSVLMVLLVPTFYERFKEVSISNTKMPTQNDEDSFNLRTGIYMCSWNIIKENMFFGVGPGNVQTQLNACYDEVAKKVYENKNYNTHNQFLGYWAGMGIAGPVFLFMILFYLAYSNYRRKEFLPVALTMVYFVSFLTENMLTRQNGIVPFAFFAGYFFYTNSSRPENQVG